jgi:hypothetical protein
LSKAGARHQSVGLRKLGLTLAITQCLKHVMPCFGNLVSCFIFRQKHNKVDNAPILQMLIFLYAFGVSEDLTSLVNLSD